MFLFYKIEKESFIQGKKVTFRFSSSFLPNALHFKKNNFLLLKEVLEKNPEKISPTSYILPKKLKLKFCFVLFVKFSKNLIFNC